VIGAQAIAAPAECFGFTCGAWEPSLKSAASTYNPGYDPKGSAPTGAPRDWAARVPNGRTADTPSDSVLILFPGWWPAGVAIEWKEQHGDTLVGIARALVADGRLKNPVSTVRAMHVPCARRDTRRRDTLLKRRSCHGRRRRCPSRTRCGSKFFFIEPTPLLAWLGSGRMYSRS